MSGERVGARIAPYVTAVTAELTKLDVVAMSGMAVLEHEDQLVLAAVKRSHTAVVLRPHAQVLKFGIGLAPGREQLAHVAPVHTDEMERTLDAVAGKQ